MKTVEVRGEVVGLPSAEVFETLVDFARYPELVDTVRKVAVEPAGRDGSVLSHWEVDFRNGVLRWSERDTFDRATLISGFSQTDGDFDIFDGAWEVTDRGEKVDVLFHARFDFGVPSVASLIEPVAVRVLTQSMQRILAGLFAGRVTFPESADALMVPS